MSPRVLRTVHWPAAAAALASLFFAAPAPGALQPRQVLVVANRNVPAGMDLARYYLELRGIPRENLLTLWASKDETVSRERYERYIAEPVRERLASPGGAEIRALAVCYGVPLRVRPTVADPEEEREIARLKAERKGLEEGLHPEASSGEDTMSARLVQIRDQLRKLRRSDSGAAVDSELALARIRKYPLAGWLANPAFVGTSDPVPGISKWDVLIVGRLDGPTPAIARRLIDDALATEQGGISGEAYLDARWPEPPANQELAGYARYDRSLHRTGALLRRRGWTVSVDQEQTLFPAGAQLPAGLYCGWYSLARYVDAFSWQRGAVGYHIASAECTTLRAGDSQAWCKRMLEEGVTATLGPVAEPYVQAFPPPELFFDFLTRGVLTLGESYLRSLPHLSWQMVLVGDPLYRPFRRPRP